MARHSRHRAGYSRMEPRAAAGDHERLARAIGSIPAGDGTVVIPGDIFAAGLLHAARPYLDTIAVFPVSSAETLDRLDDKWSFYELLVRERLPTPESILVTPPADAAALDVPPDWYPALLKPVFAEAGHGIRPVVDAAALREELGRLPNGSPIILQRCVGGYDADISLIAVDGEIRAHVVQSRRDPGSLEFIDNPHALEVASRIVRATHYSGVANIDLRIDPDTREIVVLECNPRFWFTLQASAWRGINFAELGMRIARGEPVQATPPVGGAYHLHSHLLRHLIWRPRAWREIAPYNWHGLFQALADPGPLVFKALRRAHGG